MDNKADTLPTIVDGKFFEIVSVEESKITAKCKKCDSIFSGYNQSTSNFVTHLKRAHKEILEEYETYKKEQQPILKKRRKEASKVLPTNSMKNFVTATPREKVISKTTQKIIKFVTDGMHPLSIVEEEGFQSLINDIDPKSNMSRKTLRGHITCRYDKMKCDLKKELQNCTSVCMTADLWTCRGMKRSFFGSTVHWINSEYQRKSFAMTCHRFAGNHTYDKIAEMLFGIMQEYGISNKVTKVVTDNGANFLKAFREYSLSQETDDLELDENNEFDIEYANLNDILSSDENEHEIVLPQHQACCSHTLNLVATTDSKAADSVLSRRAFAKCQALWTRIAHSTISSEKAKLICEGIITPCPTRWNSYYDCITKLLNNESKLEELLRAINIPVLSEIELLFLKEYQTCMKPIAVGLDRLQAQDVCFYGQLLPTLFNIKKDLNSLHMDGKLQHAKKLLKTISDGFSTRFKSYLSLDESVNVAIFATISNPYFKLTWVPSTERERIKKLFVTHCCEQGILFHVKSTFDEVKDSQSAFNDKYFQFSSEPEPVSEPSVDRATLLCYQYLEDSRQNLIMLNDHPLIRTVFMNTNTCLTSSGPVERLFSYSGMVLSQKRGSLTDDLFEALTLLKANKDLTICPL